MESTAAPAKAHSGFHIPSLDGIRGISVMIVFLAHAGLEKIVPGGFGVTIFFFLSGFLITTLLRREFAKTGKVSLKNFYMRRLLRIFPPLYLVVLVSLGLALAGILTDWWNWGGVFGNFAFLTNYMQAFGWRGSPGTGPLWSLAVEEHFYLLFPAVFAFALAKWPPRRQGWALGGFCAVVLVGRIVQTLWMIHSNPGMPREEIELLTYVATHSRLDSIAFGCMLALCFNPVLDDRAKVERVPNWLVTLSFATLIGVLLFREPIFRATLRYSLQGLALMPLFVAAIVRCREPVWRLLNAKPMRWLGLMSYTVYLIHTIAFMALDHFVTLPQVVRGAVALAASLGFAWAMYVLVDRPLIAVRRKYS